MTIQTQKKASSKMNLKVVVNVAFSIVLSLGLCSILISLAADKLVPGYSIHEKSYLEGSKVVTTKSLLAKSFVSGAFQKTSETYIAGRMPYHDELLLLQSGFNRQFIRLAAIPFGYKTTPINYGSNEIEDTDLGIVTVKAKNNPKSTECISEFCSVINETASKYDDVHFVVDWIAKDNYSVLNPSYDLKGSSGLVDENWIYEHNVAPLSNGIDALVDSLYDTDIDTPVFPSDSHWTLQRALESYNRVAALLDLNEVNWDYLDRYTAVGTWYGTRARSGRILDYPNTTIDDAYEFSLLEFYKLDGDKKLADADLGYRDQVMDGAVNKSQRQNLKYSGYSHYYGKSSGLIVNRGPNNGKNLLIVGDSFTHCLKRYFASNYAQTIVVLPGNEKIDSDLESLIRDNDVNDVVVMMHALKPDNIAKRSPSFLQGVTPGDEIDEGE